MQIGLMILNSLVVRVPVRIQIRETDRGFHGAIRIVINNTVVATEYTSSNNWVRTILTDRLKLTIHSVDEYSYSICNDPREF